MQIIKNLFGKNLALTFIALVIFRIAVGAAFWMLVIFLLGRKIDIDSADFLIYLWAWGVFELCFLVFCLDLVFRRLLGYAPVKFYAFMVVLFCVTCFIYVPYGGLFDKFVILVSILSTLGLCLIFYMPAVLIISKGKIARTMFALLMILAASYGVWFGLIFTTDIGVIMNEKNLFFLLEAIIFCPYIFYISYKLNDLHTKS